MKPVAIVLAGGEGKRFEPLVTPKPLLPFLNKPLVLFLLENLSAMGISQVVMVTNSADKRLISQIRMKGLDIQIVIQPKPLGMADAVLKVEKLVGIKPILVMNAADQVDPWLFKKIKERLTNKKALIVGKKVEEYFEGGYLQLKGNKVIGVVERPGAGNEPSNLVNLVFHYFPNASQFLQLVKTTTSLKDDVYEKALSRYLRKYPVEVVEYSGYWQAMKYSWQVLDMTELFLKYRLKSKIGKGVQLAKTAVIDKGVYLGDKVQVMAGAVIKAPSYIGSNSIIGNNALVRRSIIGENCVVGFGSEVARSYMGDKCYLHANYVGDSVLEGNVALGSGTVLANLRLDEQNIGVMVKGKKIETKRMKLGAMIARDVRIGVNSSIMPGLKIGTNSIVGPGVVLKDNLAANVYAYQPANLKTKDYKIDIKSR